ncbi:MAG: class I SAM-dependent methyltransferase [Kofleriaceae bacterium]|nr:class I SAM-dependent methyltransferase [Kofleriaceae bacterium]
MQILEHLEQELARGATRIEIEVLDPDRGRGLYAGERVAIDGVSYVHRPFRVWVDLAERLGLRLLTPRAIDDRFVRLVFERLARTRDSAALGDREAAPTERYGTDSEFARITKLEDPGFVLDMTDALDRVALKPGARVLDLGVNTGDELALLRARVPGLRNAKLVGVDHSASAIAKARERFAGDNVELHVADVNELGALGLGKFDLVLSIGTLQSPGVDDRELVRRIVQDHLAPDGAVILGFPNSRYVDGEVEHGTRMKNYRQPELGLLVKDVAFYRKYLQQHHRRVFVTGKHYILVTGIAGQGE